MLIRFSRAKRGEKRDVLTCLRDDGTSTWMREHPGFVHHDLVHYVVETAFAIRLGFFGLVAGGWELQSFGRHPETGERLPFPGERPSVSVESIVSLVQLTRTGVVPPADVRDALALQLGGAPPPTELTAARLPELWRRIDELDERWSRVPPGGTLELQFSLPALPANPPE